MVRELAELWLNNNCLAQSGIPEFTRLIDSAIERNHNCWLRFGKGTTKSGTAWLIYCFEEEFFAFALDERQQSLFNLKVSDIVFGFAGNRLCTEASHRPVATLKPPQVTVATPERIAGTVAYEMPFNHMLDYCLQMTWDRPDGASAANYHYPTRPLLPTGIVEFDFSLNFPKAPPVRPGVVVAFFTLYCPSNSHFPLNLDSNVRPLSDTHAVLLELKTQNGTGKELAHECS